MKYLVNGVEYTNLKEAEAAEEKYEAAVAQKKQLAETKKERADEIAKAEEELTSCQTAALKTYEDAVSAAKKIYNDAIRAAKDEYISATKTAEDKKEKLVEEFIKDFGSYHMTKTSSDGKCHVTVSDLVDTIFNSFWF